MNLNVFLFRYVPLHHLITIRQMPCGTTTPGKLHDILLTMRILKFIVLSALSGLALCRASVVLADIEPAQNISPQYRQLAEEATIFSPINQRVIPVGKVHKGELLAVTEQSGEHYALRFGFETGYISKQRFTGKKNRNISSDTFAELQKPPTNHSLITVTPVSIFEKARGDSRIVGELAGNLRYPIIGKLRDKTGKTWYQIKLGGMLGFISSEGCELDTGVPVLTYHHILQDAENKYFKHTSTTTSEDAFRRQMMFLKTSGYQTISLYQLEAYLNNRINLPGKAVVLTFDDGLKSVNKYAYPILKALNFHATAFIISSRIKRHPQKWNPNSLQFMSIAEIKQIQDVFDVQSHTHFLHRFSKTHQPILLTRSYHNILFDFERSKRALFPFNARLDSLSYPFGGYNPDAIKAAKDAGFHLAVTTLPGKVRPGDNPFTLKRLYILRTDSMETMAKRLSNDTTNVTYQSIIE